MKTYIKPLSPGLKLSKPFKKILGTVVNREKRNQIKNIFLDAEQSYLKRAPIKTERIKDDE